MPPRRIKSQDARDLQQLLAAMPDAQLGVVGVAWDDAEGQYVFRVVEGGGARVYRVVGEEIPTKWRHQMFLDVLRRFPEDAEIVTIRLNTVHVNLRGWVDEVALPEVPAAFMGVVQDWQAQQTASLTRRPVSRARSPELIHRAGDEDYVEPPARRPVPPEYGYDLVVKRKKEDHDWFFPETPIATLEQKEAFKEYKKANPGKHDLTPGMIDSDFELDEKTHETRVARFNSMSQKEQEDLKARLKESEENRKKHFSDKAIERRLNALVNSRRGEPARTKKRSPPEQRSPRFKKSRSRSPSNSSGDERRPPGTRRRSSSSERRSPGTRRKSASPERRSRSASPERRTTGDEAERRSPPRSRSSSGSSGILDLTGVRSPSRSSSGSSGILDLTGVWSPSRSSSSSDTIDLTGEDDAPRYLRPVGTASRFDAEGRPLNVVKYRETDANDPSGVLVRGNHRFVGTIGVNPAQYVNEDFLELDTDGDELWVQTVE